MLVSSDMAASIEADTGRTYNTIYRDAPAEDLLKVIENDDSSHDWFSSGQVLALNYFSEDETDLLTKKQHRFYTIQDKNCTEIFIVTADTITQNFALLNATVLFKFRFEFGETALKAFQEPRTITLQREFNKINQNVFSVKECEAPIRQSSDVINDDLHIRMVSDNFLSMKLANGAYNLAFRL